MKKLVCLLIVLQLGLALELTDWTNAKIIDPLDDTPVGPGCLDLKAVYFAYDCNYLYFKFETVEDIYDPDLQASFYITVDADDDIETGSTSIGAYIYSHKGVEYIVDVTVAPVLGVEETNLAVWDPWNTADPITHSDFFNIGGSYSYEWYTYTEDYTLEDNSLQIRIPRSVFDLEDTFALKYYVEIFKPGECAPTDYSSRITRSFTEAINCADNKDNDCDGQTDCADSQCAADSICEGAPPPPDNGDNGNGGGGGGGPPPGGFEDNTWIFLLLAGIIGAVILIVLFLVFFNREKKPSKKKK